MVGYVKFYYKIIYALNKKNSFIPVIIILRGLAALMVCLNHFVCKTTGYIDNNIVLSIFKFGGLGVNMFFIISGIVLPLSMLNGNYTFSSWRIFLVKRIIRIEPPYMVAVLLATLYMYLRSFLPYSVAVDLIPNIKDVLLHLGYLVPFVEGSRWLNGAFWTLAIEFQYYLLLIVLFPLMAHKQIKFRILFYILILMPAAIFPSPTFFTHWASLFLIGILYILNKKQKIGDLEYILMSLVSLIFVNYFLGFESVIVSVITLVIVHYIPNLKQKQFGFLGKISYSLYLVHGITGSAIINVLSHYFKETYQKPIVIIIGLFFSILCAYLMYIIIEKPSQKLASSIKYKSTFNTFRFKGIFKIR
ncbi:acyltransferase [Algibacter sp.]|nr:acyltransferase [Algibacter sp.]MDB4273905.1 acyltransferase [Algibacter sp.]